MRPNTIMILVKSTLRRNSFPLSKLIETYSHKLTTPIRMSLFRLFRCLAFMFIRLTHIMDCFSPTWATGKHHTRAKCQGGHTTHRLSLYAEAQRSGYNHRHRWLYRRGLCLQHSSHATTGHHHDNVQWRVRKHNSERGHGATVVDLCPGHRWPSCLWRRLR